MLEDVMKNFWETEPSIALCLKDDEKKRSYFLNFPRLTMDIYKELWKKQGENAKLAREIYGGLMRRVQLQEMKERPSQNLWP